MNIADAVNPFVFQLDTQPVREQPSRLISKAGKTTIYSAENELTIAGSNYQGAAQWATIVKDENDLIICGLDVTLVTDLLHEDRGPQAARNISIFCRKLTILGSEKEGLTIDVSAYADDDERLASHIQPDVPLADVNSKPADGDFIADALNNRSSDKPWTKWFSREQSDPGKGWAKQGAKGGSIAIACETLELHSKLHLKADGANGNAGIGGQSVKNWKAGLVGGDAGKGGKGGDSGTVRLVCSRVIDKKGNPARLSDWVSGSSQVGEPGDPGLPGFATDPNGNRHYGSYAKPVPPGESKAPVLIIAPDLPYSANDRKVTDVSDVAFHYPLHFWALLYHRVKYEYLNNQPAGFQPPNVTDPKWKKLGEFVLWANRLGFAYGDTSDELKNACLTDITKDKELNSKNAIAKAIKLMTSWYLTGKTMWGHSVTTVSPMPFDTLCKCIDENFVNQKGVRNFFIKLRRELADALKSNDDLTQMKNAAEYAVQMHKASYEALRNLLYGSTNKGGVDEDSLLGAYQAADADCNSLIDRLKNDLSDKSLKKKIHDAVGITWEDGLEAAKMMAFVIKDPVGAVAMGLAEGAGLFYKGTQKVTDDAGNSLAKDAVIKQIDQIKGGVDDLENLVKGKVDNRDVGRTDQLILSSLDNIDKYFSKFTSVLGDSAENILNDVKELRQKINLKNELWMDYNDRLYQLAKERDEYDAALAKKQKIDNEPQELTASLMDAVQFYTSVYLTNLERTADLWAQLMRKFAYITLDSELPSEDFVGDVSAFWVADMAGAQGMADEADGNWDINKNSIIGGEKHSDSIRYKLSQYNAGSEAIVLKAPADDVKNQKSTFYISLRGARGGKDEEVLRALLNNRPVWLQVIPQESFRGSYTDSRGEGKSAPYWADPDDSSKILDGVYGFPLTSGREWDVRVTHINPWIEGISTNTGTVLFEIRLGPKTYIMNSKSPPIANYFGYNEKAVNTEFAHYTKHKLSTKDNRDMAGGGSGKVSDENIDKRGIFAPVRLMIAKSSINKGVHAVDDISSVNMDIHFRVIFRASVRSALQAKKQQKINN